VNAEGARKPIGATEARHKTVMTDRGDHNVLNEAHTRLALPACIDRYLFGNCSGGNGSSEMFAGTLSPLEPCQPA